MKFLEGFYELGSVHLFVLLPGSFLGIGLLVFSETQHGVRCPCVDVCNRTRLFEKNIFPQKWGKWAKVGQKQGFLMCWKI